MATTVFVEREGNSRLRMANTLGRNIAKGELAVLGSIIGVALEDVPLGGVGAFHVEQGIVLRAAREDTDGAFAANGPVAFDAALGVFSAGGDVIVGQALEPIGAENVLRFAKYYKVEGE